MLRIGWELRELDLTEPSTNPQPILNQPSTNPQSATLSTWRTKTVNFEFEIAVHQGETFNDNWVAWSYHLIYALSFSCLQFFYNKSKLITLIYPVGFSNFKNNFTIALLNNYMYFWKILNIYIFWNEVIVHSDHFNSAAFGSDSECKNTGKLKSINYRIKSHWKWSCFLVYLFVWWFWKQRVGDQILSTSM